MVRKRSKSKNESNAACIQVDGVKHFDPDKQQHCFARYFEDLAIPKYQNYDNILLELCDIRRKEAETGYQPEVDTETCISEAEVGTAIDQLNSGKALDEYGLSSEHFKVAKPVIVPIVTKLFNSILADKNVPASFKTGIITPVLKKGNDPKCIENYRGITVSATFGKLFEYTIRNKMKYDQSNLQFGFTKVLSPNMAALLVTEEKAEAFQNKDQLCLATLDTQKAFDVVRHTILLDQLLDQGIKKAIWIIIKNLYSDLSSKIKWLGDCSDVFSVKQG